MYIYRLFFITLTAIAFATPATAAERLVFRDKTKNLREESVIAMLVTDGAIKSGTPYTIAAIDLNGDGVEEWIVNQKQTPDCETRARCTFAIAGLSEKKPVLLGDISARKISIAAEKTYGVNRLIVYNNAKDDFAYETYIWIPGKQAFGLQ